MWYGTSITIRCSWWRRRPRRMLAVWLCSRRAQNDSAINSGTTTGHDEASLLWDTPAGPSIVVAATLLFVLSLAGTAVRPGAAGEGG